MWILLGVFGALLVLTGITVAVAKVNLGELNLPIAMLVAVIKGSLVVLFFMHLKWDSLFNAIALISAFAFLAVFISFSMVDVGEYLPQLTGAWKAEVSSELVKKAKEHAPAHGDAHAAAPAAAAHAPAPATTGGGDHKPSGDSHAAAPAPTAEKKEEKPADKPAENKPAESKPDDRPINKELADKGKALFQSKICFTCHAVPGGPPVPTCPSFVNGIIGKKEKVTIGVGGPVQEVVVDEAYFRESIKQPMAKIVVNSQTGQPYPPVMVLPFPPTDDEITALYEYVRSLGK
jgi:cytochrome c oxidase subunit 4